MDLQGPMIMFYLFEELPVFSKAATLFYFTKHLLEAKLRVSSHILFIFLPCILYSLMENFEQDHAGQRPEQLAFEEEDLWL